MSRTACVVVFGCGGDRDKGKRPEMGAVAAAKADLAIVTDDNPRSEEPPRFAAQVLAGAPGASEIGDRACGDRRGRRRCSPRAMCLLVAGKGHETGQIVGTTVIPFSDHEAVAAALKRRGETWLSRSGPSARS